MGGTGKRVYPLLFVALLVCALPAFGLEPVDHHPIADLVAALKGSGHERIAQGYAIVPVKNSQDGEWDTTQCPLMLTTNKKTGEWTISIFHDENTGSTLLIGKNLGPVSTDAPHADGYRIMFVGDVTFTSSQAHALAAAYIKKNFDGETITVDVNGENKTLTKGELRQILGKRLQELEQQRNGYLRDGGRQSELARIDDLIRKYNNLIPKASMDKEAEETVQIKPVSFYLLVSATGEFKVQVQDRNRKGVHIAKGSSFGEKS